ncbi:MAG: hypothetical protein KAH01_04820 [Caldisericia bacterium]|nr:hypothetical protein [Caldisericia bacterium]
MKNNTEPTIIEMRRFIFNQMISLKNGEIDVTEAMTQAKLAHQVMDGYKTQVRMIEVINNSSMNHNDVSELTKALS